MEVLNVKDTISTSTLALVELVERSMVIGDLGPLGHHVQAAVSCLEPDLATTQVHPMEVLPVKDMTSTLVPALVEVVEKLMEPGEVGHPIPLVELIALNLQQDPVVVQALLMEDLYAKDTTSTSIPVLMEAVAKWMEHGVVGLHIPLVEVTVSDPGKELVITQVLQVEDHNVKDMMNTSILVLVEIAEVLFVDLNLFILISTFCSQSKEYGEDGLHGHPVELIAKDQDQDLVTI